MNRSKIAKFGDVLVNFLFSVAYLETKGTYDGFKVSNHVLMHALNKSSFKPPPRSDKHQRGDYVESIVAEAWGPVMTTEEMVGVLKASISERDMSNRELSIEAQIDAFACLLDKIYGLGSDNQLL